jgi:hypothetical protein
MPQHVRSIVAPDPNSDDRIAGTARRILGRTEPLSDPLSYLCAYNWIGYDFSIAGYDDVKRGTFLKFESIRGGVGKQRKNILEECGRLLRMGTGAPILSCQRRRRWQQQQGCCSPCEKHSALRHFSDASVDVRNSRRTRSASHRWSSMMLQSNVLQMFLAVNRVLFLVCWGRGAAVSYAQFRKMGEMLYNYGIHLTVARRSTGATLPGTPPRLRMQRVAAGR